MKILGIILLVLLVAYLVWLIKGYVIKDNDGDGDIDLKDIGKGIKTGARETKRRAKNVKAEIKDVIEEAKDVAEQAKDVAGAVKGKPRRGRKPNTKK